jgi:hypothetical protein
LPNVPNEAEIQANGLWLGEFQMQLLEKVEELTLYTLAQQETLEARQAQVIDLQAQNADLQARMADLDARLASLETRLTSEENQPGAPGPLLLGWDTLSLLAGGMLLGLVVAVRARLRHQGPGEAQ